jgi:hypothetical protein
MRRITRWALIAGAALALAVSTWPVLAGQDEGYQPAGAWAWTTSFGVGSAPALATFHKDGTVSVSDSLMFLTLNGGKMSPLHGVWERTGPKSFGGTCLYMRFNASGTFVGFSRSHSALQFGDDPDHFEGVMVVENCATGCTDPTSPAATWTPLGIMPPGGFVVSAARIQRVEVP